MRKERPPVLAQINYQQNESMLRELDLPGKFRFIYQTNMWGNPESVSGVGSSVDVTVPIRDGINEICERYAIRSLLDAPCGDCSWITASELPVEKYVGVDIVPELVERNRSRHPGSRFSFLTADLTRDTLPRCDLILCRDCLVHLSFRNISLVLQNFRKSGSRYLLATTFPKNASNDDVEDGDWRLLNLQQPPFSFPEPLTIVNEQCDEMDGAYRDKSLALWDLASLRA